MTAAVAAIAARLGVEVVGETIEGIFGLASATVTAAGEAAKGVGMAVGGALQGALSPAPVTIINSVGMAGGAGKAKVTGGGTIPVGPKKSAKPAVNSKMATEKLLIVAVNYLSSIEKTLVDQLNFERIAASQQAQAQRENAIESGGESASPYKSLGEKLGAIKEAGADKVATATKVILGGAALGTFGLLGLGEMDTTELDRLKQNWAEFQEQYKFIFDAIEKVSNFIGPEALAFGTLGYFIAGWRGGLIGIVAKKVYELTDSAEIAAAAGGAAGLLTFKTGRRLAGSAIAKTARLAAANPLAVAAGAATLAVVKGVDYGAKAIQSNVNTTAEQWENSFGLYVQSMSKDGFSRQKYKIKINERGINFFNVAKEEIEGEGHSETERFYFWNRVHVGIPSMRDKKANDAREWIRTKGQAWLNKYYPLKTNATPAPASTTTPDATSTSGSSATPALAANRIMSRSETGQPEEAQAFFESKGWTKEQAAGLVGNLVVESGLRTDAVGDGGQAYGIAQWHPDRQQNFKNYAGKDIRQSTFQEQLEFVNWELNNTEKAAGNRLRGAVSAEDAAAIVDEHYERSAGIHRQERIANSSAIMAGDFSKVSTSGAAGYSNSSSALSSLGDLTKGAMEAIGTVLRAGLGEMTPTTGSQLSGFNDTMRGNVSSATSVQGESTTTAQLARTSAQIQNAVDLGNADAAQAATQQESAGASSIRQANASNDGKLECLDPNFPGNGAVEAYLQYHRLAA